MIHINSQSKVLTTRQLKNAWKPDIPDHRDYYFSSKAKALPPFIAPIGLTNRIEDQGALGSCTGNAATSALEIVTKSTNLSRLMAYYGGRLIEGTVNYDSGCYIRDVIKSLTKVGCCEEPLWPYTISKFTQRPSAIAFKEALKIVPKVSSYQRILNLEGLKTSLSQNLPVIFGFMVPEYFLNQWVSTNAWVRLPTYKDKMIGGHAVVAVGYDDRITSKNPLPSITVRNSWGTSWGANGYFRMDQKWFSDPRRLTDDMWVIIPK